MRGLLIVLALLLSPAAQAGPWPRPAGELYVFTGHQGGGEGWSGLYAEYGLPRDLTLGLDLGGHVVGLPAYFYTGYADRQVDGRVRAFVRAPVPMPRSAPRWAEHWRAAVEVGIGRDFLDDGGRVDRFGIGASLGRGFETPLGDGWTTLDWRAAFAGAAETRTNLGLVLGLKPHPRIAVELAAFVERETETSWQIGPTMQLSVGRLGDLRFGVAQSSEDGTELVAGWALTF